MKEFDLIDRYFNRRSQNRDGVVLGIGDDSALLKPPANTYLAVSTDTLVEGIHFTPDIPAKDLGYRSLAVSLSDMAAMGAEAAWVMLSLNLPEVQPVWLEDFSDGFFELMDKYDLQLVGGNTTSGPLSVTTHVTGFIPPEMEIKRSGARPGDLIYVTGTLGDAALALYLMKQQESVSSYLLSRYHRPTPRVETGLFLRAKANAMIDISDGLAGDLNHILEQSHVGAKIWVEKLPLSTEMKETVQRLTGSLSLAFELALAGGDDYELCFTISPSNEAEYLKNHPGCTCIGVVESVPGLKLTCQDQPFVLKKWGYQHFD